LSKALDEGQGEEQVKAKNRAEEVAPVVWKLLRHSWSQPRPLLVGHSELKRYTISSIDGYRNITFFLSTYVHM